MVLAKRAAPAVACLASLLIVFASACRKQKIPMSMEDKQIDYPAAYVVNGESGTISVIRLDKNTVSETIELMGPDNSMIMWPHHLSLYSIFDMHRLAVGVPGMDLSEGHSGGMHDMKGKLVVLDAVKGKILKSLELPASNYNAIYSPDGREIWLSQMEIHGKVLVYDAQSYVLKNTIHVGMHPAVVSFSANGSKAYAANVGDNSISVIDPAGKTIITTIAVGQEPIAAWAGYDGNMYVHNEAGKSISVIDIAGNTVTQTIDLGFIPGSAAHNGVKKELWVTDPDNSQVHYWTWDQATAQWKHGGAFTTAAGAHAIAFTADGNTAYVTNQQKASVSVIDVNDHSKIKDIMVGKKPNGIVIKQ